MDMKRIKILSWNLNMAGNAKSIPAKLIGNYIKGFDILVFNETVYNTEIKELIDNTGDYEIFESYGENKLFANQIIIAVARQLKAKPVKIESAEHEKKITFPNYLQIQIEVNNVTYKIIGVRIVGDKKEIQQKECKALIDFVYKENKKLDNIIIVGDFNCGQLKGDSSLPYNTVKNKYEYTSQREPSQLKFYNWHLIKEMFGKEFILEETLGESKSWGISLYKHNQQLNFGGAKIKNDLVITSKNVNVNSSYSWGYVRDNCREYCEMMNKNAYKAGNKVNHGFPDHAQLIVEITV